MNKIEENTPIIVGVGQYTQKVPDDLAKALSHADLAGMAALAALSDAGATGLQENIDIIACVRTFSDSTSSWSCPFGGSNNFPRSVANRIGANPEKAIYEVVGGQSPQKLIGEFFERLSMGECKMVLLAGGEAMANIKAANRHKVSLNWSESVEGQLDDRGRYDGTHMITRNEIRHKLMMPMQFYALMEQARRAELNQSLEDYQKTMGKCYSKLSDIAAGNSYAMNQTRYDSIDLITVSEENPMLVSPYTKHLVAKDGVNQAAALLLTTVGEAKRLGISNSRWVFLHGYTDTTERTMLERKNIAHSQAMKQSLLGALDFSGKLASEIQHLDIYSCFPIVVAEACDILGISADDTRPLSQTGGLAFFGGPGNNYTMHGIASLVDKLRDDPGSFGLVYANGGWMSKHSTGIYSTVPVTGKWKVCNSRSLQDRVDEDDRPSIDYEPSGEAVIEAYTVNYFKGEPLSSIIIGRLKHNNKRFYATNDFADSKTLQLTLQGSAVGSPIFVEPTPQGNVYAYDHQNLKLHLPETIEEFSDSYKYCLVKRSGKTLIVTINRPEARNALHPMANQELENIFNAFEKDKSLWVAIITGAGSASFSAGNDLKYMSSGGGFWVPKTGFAGLTSRCGRRKPVIAAVNGMALGGGLEIAIACDMIVAADHALFGLPEVKVGLIAGAGGVQRLSRQIGIKNAMEIMLTGEPINCDKALKLGLINYAVPRAQILDKALELAEKIIEVSPVSVSATLQLQQESSRYASTEDAVTQPHTVFDNLLNSEDFYEGPRAFAEKRKPNWKGQ